MIEIKGKHNEAKIFTDNVDEISLKQIEKLCDQEFVAESRIRLMPDVHAGAGCTIGTTMTITDKIVPNLVGVDIGCGMETIRLAERELDLERLDRIIRERIPYGFAARKKPHERCDEIELKDLCCLKFVRIGKAEKALALLAAATISLRSIPTTRVTCTLSCTPEAVTLAWKWHTTTRIWLTRH